MTRLIDADTMIADLLTVDPRYETEIDWCCRILEAQPTVDAVPVIRCKDCVYLSHWGMTHFDKVDSGYLCSRTEDDEIELTDYCSKARRKDA